MKGIIAVLASALVLQTAFILSQLQAQNDEIPTGQLLSDWGDCS